MLDTLNSIAARSIPTRITANENIQQSIAIKMMQETMMREKEMTDMLVESGKQTFAKGLHSTFEYTA
jgi:hypothetical protein